MAKTSFSNLQTQYDSPHTHPLEDLGVFLMKGAFLPTRTVTLKPKEHCYLTPTKDKVQTIAQKQKLNWIARIHTSPLKMRIIKCLLAVASIPFMPFTILGAAFIIFFRNHSKIINKTWLTQLAREEKKRLPNLKAMLSKTSESLKAIRRGNLEDISLTTFQEYRTLMTQTAQMLYAVPSKEDQKEREEIQAILRSLEFEMKAAVDTYTIATYPPIPSQNATHFMLEQDTIEAKKQEERKEHIFLQEIEVKIPHMIAKINQSLIQIIDRQFNQTDQDVFLEHQQRILNALDFLREKYPKTITPSVESTIQKLKEKLRALQSILGMIFEFSSKIQIISEFIRRIMDRNITEINGSHFREYRKFLTEATLLLEAEHRRSPSGTKILIESFQRTLHLLSLQMTAAAGEYSLLKYPVS